MNFSSTDTLLLIIDIQKDFCDKKGNHAKRGKGLTNIQAILPKLQVFYTRAKSAGIPVIFTKFISGKTLSPENMKYFFKKTRGVFQPLCISETPGAQLYLFSPDQDDTVIEKVSYDAFAGTSLQSILQKKHIKNLLITGVQTDICIDATAKRAFSEGYHVFIVEDLVATNDEKYFLHDAVLTIAKKSYGFVVKSEDILKKLKTV